jgi:O-acetyl-ADP-ribose deacetylase (regulator of RNase III)
MIEIINGDLLDSKEKYIVHQTNCVSQKSAHLAKQVFNKFPYADVYTNRVSPDLPGSIKIKGDGINQRFVINLFGQYFPGAPKYPESTLDGYKARQGYFYKGLLNIAKIIDLDSIAFPMGIGCGAAGGDWEYYYGTIINFESFVFNKFKTKVILYNLE